MRSQSCVLIVGMVMIMASIGVGYAINYSATTSVSDNSLEARYIILSMDDGQETTSLTFNFNSAQYYRDKVIGTTSSDEYRISTVQSETVPIRVVGTNSGTVTMNASLDSNITGATVALQFYDNTDNPIGSSVPVNENGADIAGTFTIGTVYYCQATITITKDLIQTDSGSFQIGMILTATVQ